MMELRPNLTLFPPRFDGAWLESELDSRLWGYHGAARVDTLAEDEPVPCF